MISLKRFKEFLILFVLYFLSSVLQILLFISSNSQFEILGIKYIVSILPSLLIVSFNNFIEFLLPTLILTGIFYFFVKTKNNNMLRKRYYIYTFLISFIISIIILLILSGRLDFINDIIFAFKNGILVVFIHWLIEWISEKARTTNK